ncbi:MAG: ABC transporter substrate-binding protein [Chloroflexi bacterium]|nr:ABC transporter substrate-binding protein [Chloroflexota bacterium]
MRPYLVASFTRILLLATGSAIALALACGGGEAPTATKAPAPTQPPAVQPTTPPATPTAAPTPVPTPTRAPAPTVAPTATTAPRPTGPTGSLTVALPSVGAPIFVNSQAPYPRNLYRNEWGICESLATVDRKDPAKVVGLVGESWAISTDGKEMTFNIRKGIKFHGNNGEVTAEDVAFSWNEAGVTNKETLTGGGAQLTTTWNEWKATGPLTVIAPFDTPESDPFTWGFINGATASGHCVLSKKVYDTVGKDKAVTAMTATGPFEAKEWTAGNKLVAEAVVGHWRITPGFKTLTILEVPEEATRSAMMKSAQADIAQLSLKTVKTIVGADLKANDTLQSFNTAAAFMGGNYWYDPAVHTIKGEPVRVRPGFMPDDQHPWIGNPKDAARHERAKKVRQAMAHAIDRKTANDTILGGLGRVAYIPGIPSDSADWDSKWNVEFSPDKAKALLKEAGYPNGFEFNFWIPSDFPNVDVELSQAVAAMWENIGLKPKIVLLAYTAGRPNLMEKKQNEPWMWFMAGDGVRYNNAHLTSARYINHEGWNGAVEIPEIGDFYNRWLNSLKGPREQQVAIYKERSVWLREWMPFVAVADMPALFVVNSKKVKNWVMYPKIEPGAPNSFEVAEPVQ